MRLATAGGTGDSRRLLRETKESMVVLETDFYP